jgi:hypothetical protein
VQLFALSRTPASSVGAPRKWLSFACRRRLLIYITAAYWFTASIANCAVTVARALSNTFAGIEPSSVPAFIIAQTFGAVRVSPASGATGLQGTGRPSAPCCP